MARIIRIGRMYKLIKLTRLLKMLKLFKDKSKLINYINEAIKIGVGFEKLFFFVLLFFLLSHVVGCLWVVAANFSEECEKTWNSHIED